MFNFQNSRIWNFQDKFGIQFLLNLFYLNNLILKKDYDSLIINKLLASTCAFNSEYCRSICKTRMHGILDRPRPRPLTNWRFISNVIKVMVTWPYLTFDLGINAHQKKLGQGHQGNVKVRSCDLDPNFFFICKLIHIKKK